MVNTPVDINQIKQSAATGHFRSIALWLNYPLVPHAIYAQVQPDHHSGYLQVLLEFEHPPKKDTLIRLVCNRLCRLESSVIRGVYLVGRLVGTKQSLWQQRVRLTQRQRSTKPSVTTVNQETANQEATNQEATNQEAVNTVNQAEGISASTAAPLPDPSALSEQPTAPESDASQPETITATTYASEVLQAVPSYLIPKESQTQERRRRPNHSVAPFPLVQIRPATVDSTQTSTQRRINRRRLMPKEIIEQQFNYMRAIVVTGSASAAFILGCVTEAVLFKRGQVARKASPTLPTFNRAGWRPLSDVEAQEIAYRSALRGPTVPAALEPVAVMPHRPSSDPDDPTVTLVFGGEVPVGDVPVQTPNALEQVLGELEIFREADVAMIGLGKSLASADTSLQENYFDRTRSDASDALLKGGIDIVGLTGDQTMDFGRQGLIETLDTLDSAGIYRVGAGRNQQEARRPEVLEVKGQRIAYLSYAPDGDEVATLGQAGLNIQEREGIIEDIAALREAVDWIVVNYRWYGDLAAEPSEKQVNLSRSAIDAGADLVVGYHPQQLQGAEVYQSRPIVYSLGDFIFQDAPLEEHDTATLRVSLRNKQMKVEFLPVSVKDAQPQAASGETANAILNQIRQASEGLASPLQFPVILDAVPQDRPLLQPEKPVAPLKTLGELEPADAAPYPAGPADYPTDVEDYGNNEFEWPGAFESDTFDSETGENVDQFVPGAGAFEPNSFESDSFEPLTPLDSFESDSFESPGGPLDSFNTQPDGAGMDGDGPDEVWELSEPIQPMSLPKVNRDLNSTLDADDSGVELAPELGDDILMPVEQTLPGYEVLEDWGKKSSPHKEFNPIHERLNSLEPSLPSLEPSSLDQLEGPDPSESNPAAATDTDQDASKSEAISPHDEPLVGPLS